MICKKCGKELSDTAAFCPACGTPRSPQTPKNNPKKKIIIAVAAVIVVIAAVFVGTRLPSLFGSDTDSKSVKQDESSKSEAVNESTEPVQPEKSSEAAETTMEAADYDKLLANLELAYNAVEDAAAHIGSGEDLEEKAAALEAVQQTLSNLEEEAQVLTANDFELQDAVSSYYSLAATYAKVNYEFYDFFVRYNKSALIYSRPDFSSDNTSVQEDYNALKAWYETAKSEYEAFEYPSFIEGYWNEYKDILELNQTVIDKLREALSCGDILRYVSCQELYLRCGTAEEKWFNDVLDSSFDTVNRYGGSLYTDSLNLYNEIQEYVGTSKKEEYEFSYNLNNVYYDIEYVDTIYPSLYNTYNSFAIINIATYGGEKKIDIEVEIPGVTQKYRQTYTITGDVKQLFIKPPFLPGDIDLTSAKSAQINIIFYEKDGTQAVTEAHPITVKSKNDVEWYSSDFGIFTKDNILCFLTPESSNIASLKRNAIDEITKITAGRMESLPGYQEAAFSSTPYRRYLITYLQAASIMRAMYNMGVRYNMDSFSVSGSSQHVLMPDQVLEQQSGLCIETALTVASALQSADMHAFLIFPPGHAQVAVEVWNSGEGSGEYFLIETTALTDGVINGTEFDSYAISLYNGEMSSENNRCISYYDTEQWSEYLQGVQYIIDCDDSRVLGMTPFAN